MLRALILYFSGGPYSLMSADRIICYQNFYKKSIERKSPKKFVFHIFLWCLTMDTNSDFTYNKPTHYLLDYGDLIHLIWNAKISGKAYVAPYLRYQQLPLKGQTSNSKPYSYTTHELWLIGPNRISLFFLLKLLKYWIHKSINRH